MQLLKHLVFFSIIVLSQNVAANQYDTHSKQIKHITVINNSEVSLIPTAEGLTEGCIGGSLPPFFSPIAPHSTREVGIVFMQYFPACRFDVLPQPHIITYLQACHHVKADDTVTFTGTRLTDLHCEVSSA